MKLTPPKQSTFWIALVVAIVSLLGALGVVGALTPFAFWLALAAYALLALGNFVKGF